jgi:hypothetical protein
VLAGVAACYLIATRGAGRSASAPLD